MIGRIHRRREFAELSRGRRAKTETLWCRYVDDPRLVPPRVAFAVGRVVGTAVRRNRLRRRLRSILASCADVGGPLRHGGLLVGAVPGAAERSFEQLRGEVHCLLADVLASTRPLDGGER